MKAGHFSHLVVQCAGMVPSCHLASLRLNREGWGGQSVANYLIANSVQAQMHLTLSESLFRLKFVFSFLLIFVWICEAIGNVWKSEIAAVNKRKKKKKR